VTIAHTTPPLAAKNTVRATCLMPLAARSWTPFGLKTSRPGMVPYITRRIFLLVYVLLGVSLTIFLLMRLIPGDPALVMLGERATAERIVEVRRGLGLDQPLAVQYLIYLKNILTGIWAVQSTPTRASSRSYHSRFPATIELSLTALCLAGVIGVLAGIVSAHPPLLGAGQQLHVAVAGRHLDADLLAWPDDDLDFCRAIGLVSAVRAPRCSALP